jgi:hypothetical protein
MKQRKFFYCEILSSTEKPKYSHWINKILLQCKAFIDQEEVPYFAFFRRKDREFGCIIEYSQKKTARLGESSFTLGKKDQIVFYIPDKKTLKKKMYCKWDVYHSRNDIEYRVGHLADQTIIEGIISQLERPPAPEHIREFEEISKVFIKEEKVEKVDKSESDVSVFEEEEEEGAISVFLFFYKPLFIQMNRRRRLLSFQSPQEDCRKEKPS